MRKLFLVSLLLLSAAGLSRKAQGQVLIIANPSIKPTEVSKSDLKDLFTGAGSSLGGSHSVPVLLKGGTANDEFLSAYIGKNDAAFHAAWRSLVFSGQAAMPKSVESEAAVVEFVAHTPGGVGYIGKGTAHEGVKVLGVR